MFLRFRSVTVGAVLIKESQHPAIEVSVLLRTGMDRLRDNQTCKCWANL